jgi:cytochrome c-type biogenesis protein CcmH
MLWLVFTLVTLAILALLLAPLLQASAPLAARADYDLAVYRAQLAELEADTGQGMIAPDAAAAARTEIQRRMLAANPAPVPVDDRRARRTAAFVIAITLPLAAGLLYASWGSPQVAGAPYAERLAHDPAVILADKGAQLEAELAAKPSGTGYRRVAEFYLTTGNVERAAAMQKRAMALGADTATDWSNLGEIAVIAAGGAVGPDALTSFVEALKRNAREPRARFYAGLAEVEIGQSRRAVAIWRDLENDSRPDAPWLSVLRRQIAAVATAGKFDPASVPPAPPSPETLAAAVEAMNRALAR